MDETSATDVETLPPLYQKWATALLPGGIPRERVATCGDCAMCAVSEEQHKEVGYFKRSLKCCTYFPKLPNYLVGRAIEGTTPGAERLRAFIAGSEGAATANLLGVFPGKQWLVVYNATSEQGFGRDAGLLCPYVIDADSAEGPRCGIWQHRNSVCSSYFCKHVRGQTGQIFWQVFRDLLVELESTLAWWAAVELVPKVGAMLGSLPSTEVYNVRPGVAEEMWRAWKGTREDFYRATAERVEALSFEEALSMAGIKARLRAGEVREQYAATTSQDVPAHVRGARYQVVRAGQQSTLLQTPGSMETFQVPTALMPLLVYFDGRETETILADIKERTGISVAPGLVRKLCDFRVLEPVVAGGTA